MYTFTPHPGLSDHHPQPRQGRRYWLISGLLALLSLIAGVSYLDRLACQNWFMMPLA